MESKTKKTKPYWKLLFLLLIPLGFLIKWLFSLNPDITERFYALGFYKAVMQIISRITGVIPFSLWEITLILLIVYVPVRLIWLIIEAVKKRKISVFVPFLLNSILLVSAWFFLQTVLWNINYGRIPFANTAKLEIKESSVDELYQLCNVLLDKTNALRKQVSEDSSGVMTIPGGFESVAKRANKGYEMASKTFPVLLGSYGQPKSVLFSRFMSHTNIIGLYSVLSGEANIDTDIPPIDWPSTTLHEMAHQRGFAAEDEANYISFVTCMAHPDADFQYSGSAMALQYTMNALYGADKDKYYSLTKRFSPGYLRDIQNNGRYWDQFKGPTKEVANKVNDTYLKMNGETDGVSSYGRIVDLLLAQYRQNPF